MNLPKYAEVVVVGAGPTGLTLAATLRRAGLDVLVFDKVAEGANTSRAAVIHARTLEVLDELDVTRRLVAEGIVVPVFTIRDRDRVLARLDFSDLPTPYPYTLMLPQSRTEAILSQRLDELGGVVHRPWTVTAATATADGAVVTVDGRRRGRPDRAGPLRRRRRRPAQRGSDQRRDRLHRRPLRRRRSCWPTWNSTWPLPAREVQLFLSPDGLVVVAPLPGGRHRIVATVDDAPETPGLELVQQLLDHRGPGGAAVRRLAWSSRFRVQHRVADRYRCGRLLRGGRRRPRPQPGRRAGDEHRHPGRGRPRPHPDRGAHRPSDPRRSWTGTRPGGDRSPSRSSG